MGLVMFMFLGRLISDHPRHKP